MASRQPFRVRYDKLAVVWYSNFYDHPLEGLCLIKGEIWHFRRSYGSRWYHVSPLTRVQKARWLWNKWLFETCVGRHCTRRPHVGPIGRTIRRPEWLRAAAQRLYYRPLFRRLALIDRKATP